MTLQVGWYSFVIGSLVNFSHLVSLTRRHASALVIAVPSSPSFAFSAQDFALALRIRMQLPCGLTPVADTAAHKLLLQAGVRTAVHNALRDALLRAAALSDHHIRAEPLRIYELPRNSTVDGVVEPTDSSGIASSVIHQRSAFDVFTACNPQQVTVQSMHKRHKYEQSVRAAGDQFFPVPFTPSGTPYVEAMDFLRKISHTGDMLPATAGRDAPRFIHESTSYVTTTHTNHTIHACTAAAIRAAAKTMRAYALTRATNHGLLLNTAHTPPVVATPVLRATNDH